ncbi:MAG: DUF1704 domain-containing protein [bacterium]|nr:DUF1704 domain-containing protein [bacterium]
MSPLSPPNQPPLPSPAETKADKAIAVVDQRFSLVQLLTPTNLHTEQKRFLNGEIKNPLFSYRPPGVDYDRLIAELRAVDVPRTPIGELLDKKRVESIAKMRLLQSIGSAAFSEHSKEIYGLPDKEILQDAHDLMGATNPLQPQSDKKQSVLSSQTVAHNLRDVLSQYNLSDWKVVMTTDIISGVIVRASIKTVYVHANAVLNVSRLGPIITHEIETHVLTTVNGQAQPLDIFVLGFAGYTRTQEGLAAYNVESQHPELFHRPARFWSRNAIAVDTAQHASFREVFEHMKTLQFSDHFSFSVAAKVKRGLINTAEHGGFTKDYVYLAGRRDVINFIAAGGALSDLYIGKILLSDLSLLQKQPWLVEPAVLPGFATKEQSKA